MTWTSYLHKVNILWSVVFVAFRSKHVFLDRESTVDFIVAILLKSLVHNNLGCFIRSLLVRALIWGKSEIYSFIFTRNIITRQCLTEFWNFIKPSERAKKSNLICRIWNHLCAVASIRWLTYISQSESRKDVLNIYRTLFAHHVSTVVDDKLRKT